MKYLYGILIFTFCLTAYGQDGFKTPDLPGDLMVDVGLNYWDNSSDSLDQKGWSSKSIGFYYMKTKFLSNKFTFRYGAGLGLEKISLGNKNTLYSLEDSVYVDELPFDLTAVDLHKNKLAVTYLDIPLELRFYPKGTEEGEGLFIGIGGMVGLRMSAHTKWKYETVDEKIKQKLTGSYNLNTFRYGLQARVGFKGVHIFFKKYFSDTFKDNILSTDGTDFTDIGVNPRMTTIGINVTGF